MLSNDMTKTLTLHGPIHQSIDPEPGFNFSYGKIYDLSEVQLNTL